MSYSVYHVLRGGSFNNDTWLLRTTDRIWLPPVSRDGFYGFRVVVRRQA